MNSLREYLESLPLVQSDYYTPFWALSLDYAQSITLAEKIIENCYLETIGNYPVCVADSIYYTWQNTKYSSPVGALIHGGIDFYLEYSTGHMRITLNIAIPIEQFRMMLIYKAIDYDKENQ